MNTSKCPFRAASDNTPSSHGQCCSRAHCSRQAPSGGGPRTILLARPLQHVQVPGPRRLGARQRVTQAKCKARYRHGERLSISRTLAHNEQTLRLSLKKHGGAGPCHGVNASSRAHCSAFRHPPCAITLLVPSQQGH